MTISTNAFSSFDGIGNREDLADMIYNVAPHETPFLSKCQKVKATATNHEWQTDTLDAASLTAGLGLEGDVIAAGAITPTVRLGNVCQINYKTASVTTTQEAVTHAGRGSEMDYQIANKMLALKNDMEVALLANNTKVASSSGVKPELGGVQAWLTSNVSRGAGGSSGGTGTAHTNGTQRPFTETLLKVVLNSIYTNSGMSGGVTAYVSGFNKQVFSTFSGNATRMKDADNKLVASISVYESDFGAVQVVANRYINDSTGRDALILRDDMWKVAELHPVRTKELPVSGLAEATLLYIQYTLESCNQAASGIVADLTTS